MGDRTPPFLEVALGDDNWCSISLLPLAFHPQPYGNLDINKFLGSKLWSILLTRMQTGLYGSLCIIKTVTDPCDDYTFLHFVTALNGINITQKYHTHKLICLLDKSIWAAFRHCIRYTVNFSMMGTTRICCYGHPPSFHTYSTTESFQICET